MRARAYCAHPSIRYHWALRCMSRCPNQVVSLKRDPQCLRPQASLVLIYRPTAACVHNWLLKVRSEKRIAKDAQSNRRAIVLQIEGNLNQGATVKVFERAVPRTLHRIGYSNRIDCSNAFTFCLEQEQTSPVHKGVQELILDD
ncbi:hypothetical protein TNCV_1970661 [Trichonephila clavipes]|uniref:Uncharacterized protein n=1 Tax=Trichonephila clavipes TaxID=2585209 RepID=A0A8X7BE21_TRICX|nr:hypothetical protein TNCV_1970661 [Trichonephila clavipes]